MRSLRSPRVYAWGEVTGLLSTGQGRKLIAGLFTKMLPAAKGTP